jgi:hypothetical protein
LFIKKNRSEKGFEDGYSEPFFCPGAKFIKVERRDAEWINFPDFSN